MRKHAHVLMFIFAAATLAAINTAGCGIPQCRDGYCDSPDVADGGSVPPPADGGTSECRPGDLRSQDRAGCLAGTTNQVCGADGRWGDEFVNRPGCDCLRGCGTTPTDGGPGPIDGSPGPVDSGTTPIVDSYEVTVTTAPGELADGISIFQFWDATNEQSPPACRVNCSVDDAPCTDATRFTTHTCTMQIASVIGDGTEIPDHINAHFSFSAPVGAMRRNEMWSCYHAVPGGEDLLYGTIVVRRNGALVAVRAIGNTHDGCDWTTH